MMARNRRLVETVKKSKVLIVDDSKQGRLFLANIIRDNLPYEVILASEGNSVIKNIGKIKPDLILLDIMMPGINGLEVARKLKAIPQIQDIPIIFITAMESTEDKIKGFEAGGIDYIIKPYNQREVLSRIKVQIELKQQYDIIKKLNDDINYELDIARDIQNAFLQIDKRSISHMDINYIYRPLGKISGDFFDVIPLTANRSLIFIADITGHGIPAALYTMALKLLFNQIKGHEGNAGTIMKEINNNLHNLLFSDIFITASIALVDFNKMEIHYTNAAHTPAFFYKCREKKIVEIINKNFILGYQEIENPFEVEIIPFDIGDKLLFYTDGIYEIESEENKQLGIQFLRDFLNSNMQLYGSDFNLKLCRESLNASINNKFDDDLTLLHIEFK